MTSPAPAAEAALGACGSLQSFRAFEDGLAQVEARAELARCCGALLMLEQAFDRHPESVSVKLDGDHEGGFFCHVQVRGPSGLVADAKAAARAMGETVPGSRLHNPALAAEFVAWGPERLRALNRTFEDAARYWHSYAPCLFGAHALERAIERSDAAGLARQLGLDEAAAAIESARLGAQAAPGQASASPRL